MIMQMALWMCVATAGQLLGWCIVAALVAEARGKGFTRCVDEILARDPTEAELRLTVASKDIPLSYRVAAIWILDILKKGE